MINIPCGVGAAAVENPDVTFGTQREVVTSHGLDGEEVYSCSKKTLLLVSSPQPPA